jgi:hypothetical protein
MAPYCRRARPRGEGQAASRAGAAWRDLCATEAISRVSDVQPHLAITPESVARVVVHVPVETGRYECRKSI